MNTKALIAVAAVAIIVVAAVAVYLVYDVDRAVVSESRLYVLQNAFVQTS